MEKNKVLILNGIISVLVLIVLVGFRFSEELIITDLKKISPSESFLENSKVEGVLNFEYDDREYKIGEVFPVNIITEINKESIVGADIFIKFDPNILELRSEDGKIVKTEGDFFSVFPVEGQKEQGIFKFSVLTLAPKEGRIKIATVYFLAKKQGQAKLEFVFNKGETKDSNLALTGKGEDVLASVGNAILQIIK